MLVSFPMAGDFDFMCINTDKSLEPIIKPADIIALKKYTTWVIVAAIAIVYRYYYL